MKHVAQALTAHGWASSTQHAEAKCRPQENMLKLPTLDATSVDSFPKMMETLQHAATFKYFEGLANILPSSELRAKYSLNPIVSSATNGIFKVSDGETFGFKSGAEDGDSIDTETDGPVDENVEIDEDD